MIKEDYVNFEVAVLLNERGFDVPEYIVGHIYTENGNIQNVGSIEYNNADCITAPTLQMAMKWLREKHNIFIATQFGWFHGDYQYEASVVKMNPVVPPTTDSIEYIKSFREDTIEEAIMKAIRCALVRLVEKV